MPDPLMPKNGFGMKVAYRPRDARDRLERRLEGDRVIGGPQRIGVLEVDLVLAGGHFVVCRLDPDPEFLERVHHLLADLGAEVLGEVEVTGRIMRQRLHGAVLALQQEELELGAGVQGEAELLCPIELPTEDPARVTGERVAVGVIDITDDARAAGVELLLAVWADSRLPWDRAEGRQVRDQEHVRLGDARKAFDARAVEPLAVLDRLLQLVHRNLDALHLSHDVGELEADEAQVAVLRQLQGSGELDGGQLASSETCTMGRR